MLESIFVWLWIRIPHHEVCPRTLEASDLRMVCWAIGLVEVLLLQWTSHLETLQYKAAHYRSKMWWCQLVETIVHSLDTLKVQEGRRTKLKIGRTRPVSSRVPGYIKDEDMPNRPPPMKPPTALCMYPIRGVIVMEGWFAFPHTCRWRIPRITPTPWWIKWQMKGGRVEELVGRLRRRAWLRVLNIVENVSAWEVYRKGRNRIWWGKYEPLAEQSILLGQRVIEVAMKQLHLRRRHMALCTNPNSLLYSVLETQWTTKLLASHLGMKSEVIVGVSWGPDVSFVVRSWEGAQMPFVVLAVCRRKRILRNRNAVLCLRQWFPRSPATALSSSSPRPSTISRCWPGARMDLKEGSRKCWWLFPRTKCRWKATWRKV